jgi:pimeloyl-ACP methyl ester carboxylesterase
MSSGSAFLPQGQQQAGNNPWLTGMGTTGSPFGGLNQDVFSTGLAGPAQQGSGEQVLGKDTKQQDQPGASQAKEAVKTKPALPSREEVIANPEKYGKPPGMDVSPEDYARQYFHEALTELTYKDPRADPKHGGYTEEDKAFLESWGYKVPTEDVRGDGQNGNPATGLYAARFEPIDGQGGLPPIVSFRGTEPENPLTGGANHDLRSDVLDPSIGARQYEAQKEAIAQLMRVDPGQRLEVTGHSLGGALAQRAAADHAKDVSALTTFQAPGIDDDDARRWEENKSADAKVAHHFVSNDIVHRAGEQKLAGDFYEHHVPGRSPLSFLPSHTANLLFNPGDGSYLHDCVGVPDRVTHTTEDPQKDRHLAEGLRRIAGAIGSPIEGLWNGAKKAGGGLMDGLGQAGGGLMNGLGSAWNGLTGGLSSMWSGAKQGGGEIAGGVGKMWNGEFMDGLGDVGSGLLHGAGGLLKGTGQVAGGVLKGGWDVAKGLGSGLWSAGKGLFGGMGDVLGGLGRGISNGVNGLGQLALGAGQTVWDGAKSVGGSLAKAGGEVGTGLSNGWNRLTGVGQGTQTAWDGVKKGGGEIGDGVNDLLHLRSEGFGDIGRGLANGAGGLVQGGMQAGGAVLGGAAEVGKGLWNGGVSLASDAGSAIAGGAKAGWETTKNIGADIGRGIKGIGGWLFGK